MAISHGHNAHAAFVTQAALGSLTTRTKFIDIVSESLAIDLTRIHSQQLGSASQRQIVEASAMSAGSIETEGNYEELDTLLLHALGSVSSARQGGTSAYKHTFTLTKAMKAVGLSIEVARDRSDFFYEACKINQMTIRQDPGEFLRFVFDILGRTETTGAMTATTFPADLPIHQSQFAFTVDAGAVTVNNFSVTLNNNAEQRMALGTTTPKEIVRTGPIQVTGSFELDFEDLTEYANFTALTSVALVATWTNGVADTGFNYELVVTMPVCKYEGATPPVAGRGVITVPFTFVALEGSRGALDEFKIELTNTATTVA